MVNWQIIDVAESDAKLKLTLRNFLLFFQLAVEFVFLHFNCVQWFVFNADM